jgi:mono/diheme cytochrome c family protein
MMTFSRFTVATSTLAGALLTTIVVSATPTDPIRPTANDNVSVARGEYIVSTSACHDCHTPFTMGPNGPEPDMARALSGHPEGLKMPPPPKLEGAWVWAGAGTNTAFAGPWGISFTANLTPDKETGLGSWTADQFVTTIRTGKHLGKGRPILPPMPWPVYRNLTDDDLKSVFAYLQTLKPIRNKVPEPIEPAEGGR